MRMFKIFWMFVFIVSGLVEADGLSIENLETQKILEINLINKVRSLEAALFEVNSQLSKLQKEINHKELQQLQTQQTQLNQQQLELNRQWVDLKVLVEKVLKQNKHLETLIFQELKQVSASESFLKENLLVLCKKVEALEHPYLLFIKLKEYRYHIIGVLLGLLIVWVLVKMVFFLKRFKKNIPVVEDGTDKLPLVEQINLAKAHLELGDNEEARLILEKLILQQEDEKLREEARNILNQLEK